MTMDSDTESVLKPNWRHVGAFLGLTFGLTCLLDLAIYLSGGLSKPGVTTVLQLQMLLPAFSAILLGCASSRRAPSTTPGLPGGDGGSTPTSWC